MPSAHRVRINLQQAASTALSTTQAVLSRKQSEGGRIKEAAEAVSVALGRVERLEHGVEYTKPDTPREEQIAELGEKILLMALDGPTAAEDHGQAIVEALEEIRALLPGEDRFTYFVARQGQPFQETGRTDQTPATRFDVGKLLEGEDHREAISHLVRIADDLEDPHCETPPIQNGEVVVAIRMRNSVADTSEIWVERVKRPVYIGDAPRDNTADGHWLARQAAVE